MKKNAILSLLLAAIMLLASCTNTPAQDTNNPDGTSGQPTSDSSSNTSSPSGPSGGTDPTPAVPKRTEINFSAAEAFSTFDPHYPILSAESGPIRQMYETFCLVEDDYTLTPLLAERYEVAEDGVTYTFYLRKGIKFHNGEELKADDVIFSLQRAKDSPYQYPYTYCMTGFEKVDEYTVKITSEYQFALFAHLVSGIAIVNEKQCTEAGDSFKEHPCGTGAYYFDSQQPNVSLTLKAFEDSWRGSPSIKTINYKVITDPSSALIAFESGEIDMVSVPTADWEMIKAQNKWETVLIDTVQTTYVVYNNEVAPFNDVRVRQAINHAIDRETMVIIAYDGIAEAADVMANPHIVFGATADTTTYEYNPEKARQLLAEAGYPNGLDIPPIQTIGAWIEKVATILQSNLADVGIRTTIEMRESADYVTDLISGNYAIGGMNSNVGYDFSIYSALYQSNYINSNNLARYSNPRVDELFTLGAKTIDPSARQSIYKELIDILQKDAVYAPVFFVKMAYAYNRDLNYRLRVQGTRLFDCSWKS